MEDILREIGSIARSLDSISNIEFKQYELSKGQYLYLARVFENPGIILKDLCELICVDKTTGSRAINNMVKNGLLIKKTDGSNNKNQHLYVTKKGEELYPIINNENNYSSKVATIGLNSDEIKELTNLLNKVKTNVVKDWKDVKNGKKRDY